MRSVHIIGWRPGLLKVTHTQLLQKFVQLSLSDAKRVTDRVLFGEHVVVRAASLEVAQSLANQLSEIGAIVEVCDDSAGAI